MGRQRKLSIIIRSEASVFVPTGRYDRRGRRSAPATHAPSMVATGRPGPSPRPSTAGRFWRRWEPPDGLQPTWKTPCGDGGVIPCVDASGRSSVRRHRPSAGRGARRSGSSSGSRGSGRQGSRRAAAALARHLSSLPPWLRPARPRSAGAVRAEVDPAAVARPAREDLVGGIARDLAQTRAVDADRPDVAVSVLRARIEGDERLSGDQRGDPCQRPGPSVSRVAFEPSASATRSRPRPPGRTRRRCAGRPASTAGTCR